jgi:hypothetical protein
MQEFQRKKDKNLLFFNNFTDRDNSNISTDQTKNLYDYTLKHEGQIKRMEAEISNIKSQLIDLSVKYSFNTQKNNIEENINSSYLDQIIAYKEDIKNDLMKDINNLIISQYNEFKEKFENLKEKIELFNDEKFNNNRIMEITDGLENLNQKFIMKGNEKNNFESIILNKINNDNIEINNTTENIIKRIDIIDLDFDRLVQSLKSQFLTNANAMSKLETSKVNIEDYEKQINLINKNMEELNTKINNNNNQYRNGLINKKHIINNNNNNDNSIKAHLIQFKSEVYNDMEKINLKILNELKNQADDIKTLFNNIKLMNDEDNTDNLNANKNIKRDINFNSFDSYRQNDNSNTTLNIMSLIETELSKKANLDQLNFALETQSKLNEAFSSASRICRFCWDCEGILKDDKYIIWTIQNINTALDVFKWEENSENITILQNGVYKIVIGLIGLEKNKNFGIIFNDDKNIVVESKFFNKEEDLSINENDMNKDKGGNVVFMEKYIACIENTTIKAIIFNKVNNNDSIDDNSEEAFLEIIKII